MIDNPASSLHNPSFHKNWDSMKNPLPPLFVAAAVICFTFGSPASAQELVVDGGFEAAPPAIPMETTGPFGPAWTVVDPSGNPPGAVGSNSNVGHDTIFAHSGDNHANLGAVGVLGSLSQNLATTNGGTYNLSFWLANDSGAAPNEFDVFWNGAQIYTQTNAPVSLYTQFTFNGLAATGPSTTLEFRYRNDDDYYRLDDVSVQTVPEPGVVWLLPAGLALVGLRRFQRR